jgi:hypothetical protein
MGNVVDSRSASRWPLMDQLLRYAVTIIVGSALLALSKDRFLKLLSPSFNVQFALDLFGVILLIAVVTLVFRWVFAIGGEMRLLRDYFPDQIGPQPAQVYVWTILFSILLGTLGSLTGNIIAFSSVFAVYSLGDIWGQSLRDAQLKEAFRQRRNLDQEDADIQRKMLAIEHFYLETPQLQRSATVMFFSFSALSLALIGNASQSPGATEWLHVAAYIVAIATIVISEVVIWRWRKARDDVIGETYSF